MWFQLENKIKVNGKPNEDNCLHLNIPNNMNKSKTILTLSY